jgi:hypothetical protein
MEINQAISGAILLGHWAIGLYFFRFGRRSGDRFFAFFGGAFWLLAVERILLLAFGQNDELKPYIYSVRLVAFLLILCAIYDKNRNAKSFTKKDSTEKEKRAGD